MRDNLIPILFFLFMIINIYLDKTKRKKRRAERRRQEQEAPQELPTEVERYEQREQNGQPDLAAEFERRLKKTTEQAETQKRQQKDRVVSDRQVIHRDDARVVHDSARVHRDNEALSHDSRGRIHRDEEPFAHDKGRVYRDQRGDYSYSEEQMNAAAAAFNARYAREQEIEKRPRVQLRHKALVNGFIMSQVLDKPRALKPYEECK